MTNNNLNQQNCVFQFNLIDNIVLKLLNVQISIQIDKLKLPQQGVHRPYAVTK